MSLNPRSVRAASLVAAPVNSNWSLTKRRLNGVRRAEGEKGVLYISDFHNRLDLLVYHGTSLILTAYRRRRPVERRDQPHGPPAYPGRGHVDLVGDGPYPGDGREVEAEGVGASGAVPAAHGLLGEHFLFSLFVPW